MAKRTTRRDLKKETFWRRTVRRQAGSGMSVRAWCWGQGVAEARFYWWRRELARRDAERTSGVANGVARHANVGAFGIARHWDVGASGVAERMDAGPSGVADGVGQRGPALFVPVRVAVRVAGDVPEGSWIEIVWTGGRRVRVVGSVDRGVLADVLDELDLCWGMIVWRLRRASTPIPDCVFLEVGRKGGLIFVGLGLT